MSYVVWGFVRVYLLLLLVGAAVGAIVGVGYGVAALTSEGWGIAASVVFGMVALPLMIAAVGLLDRLPEGTP